MATTRSTPKKAPKTHFSIEAAEREHSEQDQPEVFTIDLGEGSVARMKSAQELDWQVAATLTAEEPFLFLRTVVYEEDYPEFSKRTFSLAIMRELVAAWQDHYGIDPAGN